MKHSLLGSAVCLAVFSSVAFAQEFEVSDPSQETAQTQQPGLEVNEAMGGDMPIVDAKQSKQREEAGTLPEFLAAIAAERNALAQRSEALDLREAELAFTTTALAEQHRQLNALKEEITNLLDLSERRHSEDITRLVKMYRAMKPVDAGSILSTGDLEVSVLVIAAMSERDAGAILAKMDPVRAQAISKIILQRSRLPGDQRLSNVKVN